MEVRGRVNGESGGWGGMTVAGGWKRRRGCEGKGLVLGVGRKVGSRNGSRGCCATINTPRDATRHVSFSPSLLLARSLALSLTSTLVHSLSLSLGYTLLVRRSRRVSSLSLSNTAAAYRRFLDFVT